MDSTTLYEQTFEKDKPFINQIIEEINQLIETEILNNEEVYLEYDTTPITENLPPVQTNRITGEVIKYFRSKGIKCRTDALQYYSSKNEQTDYFPYNYNLRPNNFTQKGYVIKFRFYIRNAREYTKSYC